MRRPCLVLALALTASTAGADEPTGIAAFAREPQWTEVSLSPGSTHVAAIKLEGNRRVLTVIDLAKKSSIPFSPAAAGTMAGSYYWANDHRLVVEAWDQDVDPKFPVSRGEIFAVDADGRGGMTLFGYRIEPTVGTHIKKAERKYAWGRVLATLRNDDRHVLIEERSWDEVGDTPFPTISKLDVYTGASTTVTSSPMRSASYLTDENDELRIAWNWWERASSASAPLRLFWRNPGGSWVEVKHPEGRPLAVLASGTLYVADGVRGGGFGVFAVDLATGSRRLVSRNDMVIPRSLVQDPANGRILAVEYEPDLPAYDWIDENHPLVRALDGLLNAYPDANVEIVSTTRDARKAVVAVYSDRRPVTFELLDVAKLTARPILEARPWIHADAMGAVTAFHTPARDGTRIHGYLTMPPGFKPGAAPPPLVVMPHGGPHFVRDYWGFDPEAQLFAHEGFAVLQVNYRGSDGYGGGYEEEGFRHWGDRVIEDVIDATRFVINKGLADGKRVCAFGRSFGAYASLQAAILAPNLFRCAIGESGVYDLTRLDESDFALQSRLGRGYLKKVLGEDEAALRRASPAFNADKLVARVLLIHGKEDKRAPFFHAKLMRDALVSAGRPPETMFEWGEGHGFSDEANRERMYTRVVAFLHESFGQNMPAGAAPPTPVPPASASSPPTPSAPAAAGAPSAHE